LSIGFDGDHFDIEYDVFVPEPTFVAGGGEYDESIGVAGDGGAGDDE
jgi:hypothetical protein